jgi:hypothetical protein
MSLSRHHFFSFFLFTEKRSSEHGSNAKIKLNISINAYLKKGAKFLISKAGLLKTALGWEASGDNRQLLYSWPNRAPSSPQPHPDYLYSSFCRVSSSLLLTGGTSLNDTGSAISGNALIENIPTFFKFLK